MRVFITGATGFIGSAVVNELIGAGHQVLGLVRSDKSAEALVAAGGEPHRGDITDLDSLKTGAAQADAVIHTAFRHDFSFSDADGMAKFAESCAIDKLAIETLGSVLAGSDRPFIVTSGIPFSPTLPVTEETVYPVGSPMPRVSEPTALGLIAQGVRVSVIRVPQVHDTRKQGLVTFLIALAREKGVSAYIAEGNNRWPAAHVLDVGQLYRLALDHQTAGAKYHAVGEEGVALRDIAESIARVLNIPAVSLSREEAPGHFGAFAAFVGMDMPASSTLTQEWLGWTPTRPGMIADLNAGEF